jgi:hypothetical protein
MAEQAAPAASKGKKDRSPSFPFIPLSVAVQRLEAFESYFGRHPATAARAGLAWGLKEASSAADQTLAALRSFGLVEYNGTGPRREVSVSEDGRKYLRAQQDSVKEAVLKTCALRPRVIRQFWAAWGAERPADAVAIDTLVLDNAFSDNGARAFLKVYDATVAFAKLSTADKVDVTEDDGHDEGDQGPEIKSTPPNPPLSPTKRIPLEGPSRLMDGERELTTGILSKDTKFRLIVSGPVGVKEIERLISKLELDKDILAEIDYVEGSWHFIELTSDMAEQEVAHFANALRSKFNASGMPEGCAAYRKQEPGGVQLVMLNPQASSLVSEMPLWASSLHSINVGQNPDLGAFKPMGIFN